MICLFSCRRPKQLLYSLAGAISNKEPERRGPVIPDPRRPQVQDRPRYPNGTLIPIYHGPQIEGKPRYPSATAPVIPDPRRPQVQDRPRYPNGTLMPLYHGPEIEGRPRYPSISIPRDDRTCIPGSRFSMDEGCNWCTCGSAGHAMCTQKACLGSKCDCLTTQIKRQIEAE